MKKTHHLRMVSFFYLSIICHLDSGGEFIYDSVYLFKLFEMILKLA
jgi:hypothetical protein